MSRAIVTFRAAFGKIDSASAAKCRICSVHRVRYVTVRCVTVRYGTVRYGTVRCGEEIHDIGRPAFVNMEEYARPVSGMACKDYVERRCMSGPGDLLKMSRWYHRMMAERV